METAEEKLVSLSAGSAVRLAFQRIEPDKNQNWIDLSDNDWENLLPTAKQRDKGHGLAVKGASNI